MEEKKDEVALEKKSPTKYTKEKAQKQTTQWLPRDPFLNSFNYNKGRKHKRRDAGLRISWLVRLSRVQRSQKNVWFGSEK